MLKLTIKRKKWLRGDNEYSYLLRASDKKMCCLGFLSLQCGYTKNDILGVSEPSDLEVSTLFPRGIINKDGIQTKTCSKLMEVNDNDFINDTEREKKLTTLFKRIKIKATFVD